MDKKDKKYGDETLLHKIGLVWLGMALLCVPIWWQTTSVERFPIPHSMIQDLHSKIQQIPDPKQNMMTLSENYDILVSLILPDEYADWNIEKSSKYLTDWTSQMSDIAEFTVSSQIIYHPVSYERPAKMGDGWNYSKSRLSNVINTIETHLDSNLNPNSKLIQLVILVPQFNRMPLFIEETNKRCLLPDWGSIAILDDFSSQMDGEIQSLSGLELDVGDIIKSFVDDLEVLFDIKNLKMGRILENLKTSSNSMVSLSSLLQRVHNMVINEDVANRISNAVQLGNEAFEHLERGEFDSALKLSRQSIQDSESAFFDPSLLELLYFPQDQKFAIYVPLFLPVALPILSGALQAFKYFKAHFLHSKKAKIE